MRLVQQNPISNVDLDLIARNRFKITFSASLQRRQCKTCVSAGKRLVQENRTSNPNLDLRAPNRLKITFHASIERKK